MVRYGELSNRFNFQKPQLDFVNGLKVGFLKENNDELHFSFMHYNSEVMFFNEPLYTYNVFQLGFGLNKEIYSGKRLSCKIGGDLLFQYVSYDGDIIGPGDGFINVSNVRIYEPGITAVFQLNYLISEKIALIASTRYGLYYGSSIDNSRPFSDDRFTLLFEPLSSLGLRYNL